MKWKNLIFANEEEKKEEKFQSKFSEIPETKTTIFPSSNNETKPIPPMPTSNVPLECAPHMDSIMKLYEEGFSSLNKPGIEFFEYFEAIVDSGAGLTNPTAHKMAFKMLSGMEKSLSKDSLISQSAYYINELNKVHSNYKSAGVKKSGELSNEKTAEETNLKNDVQILKEQLESIKSQITNKELQLTQIDGKYQPKIQELECKILANDEAKNRIMVSIDSVVEGIKNNL